uniref:Uncharacterized protein n=1 Tax=Physcomitrium patens TaxID=3218 RepID=A0A7I4DVR7_PHYPA
MVASGQRVRCKQHTCQELCKLGHCPLCTETIFAELTCACGRISKPLPLFGAQLPGLEYFIFACRFKMEVSFELQSRKVSDNTFEVQKMQCSQVAILSLVVHEATHRCHFGDSSSCTATIPNEGVGDNAVLRGVSCSIWMAGVERGGGVSNG